MRVRSEDHVGAGVDHPVGLADLVRPRPCFEFDPPMDHDEDQVRGSSRLPDGPEREPEVVAGGRSRLVRARDLVERIEHLVDSHGSDRPAVDLERGRTERLRPVGSGSDRGEPCGPDGVQ
jgi:hypothetical protein